METNYDKVEQSNGGKNMRFFEYLKKQDPSKENEEARKRIYKLHQLEGSLTYIERMEIIEEGKGSMEVEFVRGELSEGMTLCFYDNQGKESGRGAYICYNLECLEKAKKSKRIEKSLETPISEEIYSQIENIIKKQSGGDVIG